MRKEFILFLGALLSLSGHAAEKKRPNIIFILTDDLGYGDVKFLNEQGKIKTPNIDRMAERGAVFADAHSSSAVSTPTRYGILTGRYNWRTSLKNGVLGFYDKPLIPSSRTTMAIMLRNQGYKTACIGKWHLGMNYPTKDGNKPIDTPDKYNLDFSKEITGGPCDVGFDYFFGVDAPNYPPFCYIENRRTIGLPDVFYPASRELDCRAGRGLPDWSLEEVLPTLEKRAVDYINQSAKAEKPFFLYLPLTSPHTPIVPTSEFQDQSGLNKYADFVMQTDAVVGNIMEALKRNKIDGNTIVVFTSDNGCSPCAEFDVLDEKGHDPSYIFRGMKSDLFEGGHHVPCIVQWPEQIKSHRVEQTICLTDFMATFAAITDYTLADNEGEDSYNILPLLVDPNHAGIIREATVHHSIAGHFSIRQGEWKLLLSSSSGGWSVPRPGKKQEGDGTIKYQLYNLKTDPSESENVALQNQEKVAELEELVIKYIKEGRSTKGNTQQNDFVERWSQIEYFMP